MSQTSLASDDSTSSESEESEVLARAAEVRARDAVQQTMEHLVVVRGKQRRSIELFVRTLIPHQARIPPANGTVKPQTGPPPAK